jgi:TPR repeat protein
MDVITAELQLNDQGGPKDKAAGLATLEKVSGLRSPNAEYLLGLIYLRGLHGVTKDPTRASALLKAALEDGQKVLRIRH